MSTSQDTCKVRFCKYIIEMQKQIGERDKNMENDIVEHVQAAHNFLFLFH